MFIRPESKDEAKNIKPNFTIVSAPHFKADPEVDGTKSETFVIISFKHKVILIGGTEYAGEMKKGIFSVMNYLLPMQDIMSMHCSANVGEKVMSLYSLDYQALVKQPFQLIQNENLLGMMNMAGTKMVYLTLKVDAMPKQSTSLKKKNLKFMMQLNTALY